jgi:hypothetical protein
MKTTRFVVTAAILMIALMGGCSKENPIELSPAPIVQEDFSQLGGCGYVKYVVDEEDSTIVYLTGFCSNQTANTYDPVTVNTRLVPTRSGKDTVRGSGWLGDVADLIGVPQLTNIRTRIKPGERIPWFSRLALKWDHQTTYWGEYQFVIGARVKTRIERIDQIVLDIE